MPIYGTVSAASSALGAVASSSWRSGALTSVPCPSSSGFRCSSPPGAGVDLDCLRHRMAKKTPSRNAITATGAATPMAILASCESPLEPPDEEVSDGLPEEEGEVWDGSPLELPEDA